MAFFKELNRKQMLGKAWLMSEYRNFNNKQLDLYLKLCKEEMQESHHPWLNDLHNILETKIVEEYLLIEKIDYEWSFE